MCKRSWIRLLFQILGVVLSVHGQCKYYEFTCDDDSGCLSTDWLCDGMSDCQDNSDENNCENGILDCPDGYFRCTVEGVCVPGGEQCDGIKDCTDGADEMDCECKSGEFSCDNGVCIDELWVCDGMNDCGDNSDETNVTCNGCADGERKCPNGMCVSSTWFCDDFNDCGDNFDESNCGNVTAPDYGYPMCSVSGPLTNDTTMILTCQSKGGNPLPTLEWSWGDLQLVSSIATTGDVIEVTSNVSLTQEHIGATFTCSSAHIKYMKQRTCSVEPTQYRIAPEAGYPLCSTSHQYLIVGDVVSLICESRGGSPPPTLEWSSEDKSIGIDQFTSEAAQRREMKLSVTTELQGALYTCTSNHSMFDQPKKCTVGPLQIMTSPGYPTTAPSTTVYSLPTPKPTSVLTYFLLVAFLVCLVVSMCLVAALCWKSRRNDSKDPGNEIPTLHGHRDYRKAGTSKKDQHADRYAVREQHQSKEGAVSLDEADGARHRSKWRKNRKNSYDIGDVAVPTEGTEKHLMKELPKKNNAPDDDYENQNPTNSTGVSDIKVTEDPERHHKKRLDSVPENADNDVIRQKELALLDKLTDAIEKKLPHGKNGP